MQHQNGLGSGLRAEEGPEKPISPEAVPAEPPEDPELPTLRRTLIGLGCLYLVEPMGVGMGWMSLVVACFGLAILAVGSLGAPLQKRHALAENRLRRAALYVGFGVLAVVTVRIQSAIAKQRGQQVLAACRQFQAKRGVYPDRLKAFVPVLLREEPRPKPTLLGTSYHDSSPTHEPDAQPWLYDTDIPGGSRLSSYFKTGRWTYSDQVKETAT